MRKEPLLKTAVKVWLDFKRLCIVHIILMTFVRFFITPESARMCMIADWVSYAIVLLVIARYTRDFLVAITIALFNSIIAPNIVVIFFYPLLMAIGEQFLGR